MSLVLCVILCVILVHIERKLVNFTPKTTVLMSLRKVDEGTELNSSDFIEKSVDADLVTIGSIRSKDDIKGKYALETIYPNEIVNKNRIVDKNNSTNIIIGANQSEYSIPVGILNDPFAGTLRGNDTVDILYTNAATPNNPSKTVTLVPGAKIVGAMDSTGKLLLPSDKNLLSAVVIFSGTSTEATKVASDINTGKFKLVKLSANSSDSGNQ